MSPQSPRLQSSSYHNLQSPRREQVAEAEAAAAIAVAKAEAALAKAEAVAAAAAVAEAAEAAEAEEAAVAEEIKAQAFAVAAASSSSFAAEAHKKSQLSRQRSPLKKHLRRVQPQHSSSSSRRRPAAAVVSAATAAAAAATPAATPAAASNPRGTTSPLHAPPHTPGTATDAFSPQSVADTYSKFFAEQSTHNMSDTEYTEEGGVGGGGGGSTRSGRSGGKSGRVVALRLSEELLQQLSTEAGLCSTLTPLPRPRFVFKPELVYANVITLTTHQRPT